VEDKPIKSGLKRLVVTAERNVEFLSNQGKEDLCCVGIVLKRVNPCNNLQGVYFFFILLFHF